MLDKKEVSEMIRKRVAEIYGPLEFERNAEYWHKQIDAIFADDEPATETACNSDAEAEADTYSNYAKNAWDSYISNGLCFNNNYNNKRI